MSASQSLLDDELSANGMDVVLDDDDDDDDSDGVDEDDASDNQSESVTNSVLSASASEEDASGAAAAVASGSDALRDMRHDNPFADEDMQLLRAARAAAGSIDYKQPLLHKSKNAQHKYGMATMRDVIRAPRYEPDDWIWTRGAASLVYDEDARAHQRILQRTLPLSSDKVPRRGEQRVVVPPASLDKIHFHKWMHSTTPPLRPTNVVSTFHLGNSVQLPELCRALAGAYFNPLCFAAVKLTCDTATHLIFPGGSVVCPGAAPIEAAYLAGLNCTEILQRARFVVEFSQFCITNIASTAFAGFEIDLRALARAYPLNVLYDTDCFPGLRFRSYMGSIVVTVFKNGRCNVVGATSRADSLVFWRWLHSCVLWQFEMHNGEMYTTEADYRRRTQVENSIVDSMCESLRDMTQAHVAKLIKNAPDATPEQIKTLYQRRDVADEYFRGVVRATDAVGYGDKPPLTLDDFLEQMLPN